MFQPLAQFFQHQGYGKARLGLYGRGFARRHGRAPRSGRAPLIAGQAGKNAHGKDDRGGHGKLHSRLTRVRLWRLHGLPCRRAMTASFRFPCSGSDVSGPCGPGRTNPHPGCRRTAATARSWPGTGQGSPGLRAVSCGWAGDGLASGAGRIHPAAGISPAASRQENRNAPDCLRDPGTWARPRRGLAQGRASSEEKAGAPS